MFLVCVLILLLNFADVHSQSMNYDNNENSDIGSSYHPFPEMNRFLNSDSRIHYSSLIKTSTSRPSFSLLGYICSIANNNQHIEDILTIFGEHYRSLIKTIIKQDCSNNDNNKQDKRVTININQNKFSQILFHNSRRLI